jgi:hypothetical protein
MGTIFGIVGAVLAIAGYFLPWTIQASGDISSSGSPVSFPMVSGWDILTQWLNGSAVTDGQSAGQGTPLFGIALVAALPLLLAVVALVICAIALVRRPGPVLIGLFVSAGLFGLLTTFSINPNTFIAVALVPRGGPFDASPWLGTGIAALYLGYFGILAGGLIAALSQRQAASQG